MRNYLTWNIDAMIAIGDGTMHISNKLSPDGNEHSRCSKTIDNDLEAPIKHLDTIPLYVVSEALDRLQQQSAHHRDGLELGRYRMDRSKWWFTGGAISFNSEIP